ncbi:MAG TPA: heme ABC transporter ATP-binding protein [Candidatus Agrococcus pullicola]|uniref:Heme ABC transporter ATP-binding protein n=1 Tax=Candidatus Agrococcus pullicola TaxID=2838429 RepID=A0A9D2C9B6_9MICO|nr:heme ABC transporter ATP-binding protein [Candidatus Agrococcus pullicola]
MTAVLQATGVTVKFGEQAVLNDVTLGVEPGEVVSLIGPNGAGKSTLLAVLAGDRSPDTGTVLLFDRPLDSVSMKQRARERAVLEQRPTVGFAFRVHEVVKMGRTPWHGTELQRHDEEIVDEAMHAVEVAHLAFRDVLTLSGGESSRMSIARVLAQRTPVVLLDEPAAALDVRHQEQIMRIARDLAAQGSSVIVVSHDLDSAVHWSDRVALLDRGRIRADGVPGDVLSGELLSEVYETPIEMFEHPETRMTVVRPVR